MPTERFSDTDVTRLAADLAGALAATAVARDQAGGHAAAERQAIRDSGLLTLSIPAEFGGQGAGWPAIYRVIRILARADSALAHVFAFHHLQLAGVTLYGDREQQRHFFTDTVERRLFWGNALNPLDRRTIATASGDGYRLDGVKSFSSGSVGSDLLTISAWDAATQTALIGVVATDAPGVRVEADWDAFGQRQTDSGNVHFTDVFLPCAQVLQRPGVVATPQATLRSQIAQLIMGNLYLGIAEGAYAAARDYVNTEARPWFASGVDKAADDPFIEHRFGELWLLLAPAEALADRAAATLEHAWQEGALLTAAGRGRVAIDVATAKCLAHRAAIDISSQMFELMGARATSQRYGFDRFWRNARVHTLHDPIDYKLRDLGRYALDGSVPDPTAYS